MEIHTKQALSEQDFIFIYPKSVIQMNNLLSLFVTLSTRKAPERLQRLVTMIIVT